MNTAAPNLTPRDTRMLAMLAKGKSSREIAAALEYTDGTIRVYLHQLYKKIRVNNKTQAAVWYLKRGRELNG
jgi:DNA-binding NarL/FixJ family response regulator